MECDDSLELVLTDADIIGWANDAAEFYAHRATEECNAGERGVEECGSVAISERAKIPQRKKTISVREALDYCNRTTFGCHTFEPEDWISANCVFVSTFAVYGGRKSKMLYQLGALASFKTHQIYVFRSGYHNSALHRYNLADTPLGENGQLADLHDALRHRDVYVLSRGNTARQHDMWMKGKPITTHVKACHTCSSVPCRVALGLGYLTAFHSTITCALCSLVGWLTLYRVAMPLANWKLVYVDCNNPDGFKEALENERSAR